MTLAITKGLSWLTSLLLTLLFGTGFSLCDTDMAQIIESKAKEEIFEFIK